MKCEKDLIYVKAAFFTFNAVLACFVPYKALYQLQLGLTPSQNGIVQAIEKFMTLLAPPLIGVAADKLSRHKILMMVCVLLSVVFTIPMYFIPPMNKVDSMQCCIEDETIVSCDSINIENCTYSNGNTSIFGNCKSTVHVDYSISCTLNSIEENLNSSSKYQCENSINNLMVCTVFDTNFDPDKPSLTFILLIVFTILFSFFIFPVSPLIDAAAFNMLGPTRLSEYGKQRLWGSLGFGVVGLFIGFLVDLYSNQKGQVDPDYLFLFIGTAVFGVITACLCYKLKVPEYKTESVLAGLKILAKNVKIAVFLFIVLISGFIIGVRFTFGFWYASTLPYASRTLFGLSILTSCVVEIPMFFISGWIANKIGCPACLSIGLLAASLRCYLYTVIPTAWYLLLIDPLHGFSFALPMSAMCTYATILSPPGMTSTMIGLTQGVYWGLGNMLGSLIGGFLYKQYGAIMLFEITAGIGCSAVFLYVGAVILLEHCRKTQNNQEIDDNKMKDEGQMEMEPLNKNTAV